MRAHRRFLCWCALPWAAAAACAVERGVDPAGAALDPAWLAEPRTAWFGVYVDGHKAGHSHLATHVESRDGAPPIWVRRSGMVFRVTAAGEPVNTLTDNEEVFEAVAPYRLLRSRARLTQRGESTTTEVTRRGDALVLRVERGGELSERELPPLRYDLRDALAERIWLRARPAVGAAIETRLLDTDAMRIGAGSTKLVGVHTGIANGVPVHWFEIERRARGDATVERERVDADGETLSWTMGSLELRREPEARAKRLDVRADLLVLGTAPVDQPLGDPRAVSKLTLAGDGGGLSALVDGPGQTVEREGARRARGRIDPAAPGPVATPDEIAACQRETLRYPCRDASLVEMARRAIGDARDDAQRVALLVAFVTDFVADSYAHADHPTVHDVVRSRRGDCSDHALLFTTLARAVGIPARGVAGLVYLGDDSQAFGPHEWCEVVLDGRWSPVDPTWGQTRVDATHVRLHDDALASPLSARFRLRVLDVERRG